MRIGIATCRAYPALYSSDTLYAAALERLGCSVDVLEWNAAQLDAFGRCDAIVIRATWDYQDDMSGFDHWLDQLETLRRPVFNTPALMRWNNDKRCLLDLARKGVAIPATIPLVGPDSLDEAIRRIDGDHIVLKPCWGGGGIGVDLAPREAAAAVLDRLTAATGGRAFMVQEYLPEIADGELSFVFVAGRHAHTVLKRPAAGEFRVNGRYSPPPPVPYRAADRLVADATAALAAVGSETLYARIDGVVRNDRLICTEIELTEPTLYMDVVPETAPLFAEATLRMLAAASA